MINILVMLHVIAVVIWVGGMLFAHMQLRPVAGTLLEPPIRLKLWVGVFTRFFPWVWGSIFTILVTGFWLISLYGGFKVIGMHINAMMAVGIIMMLIFFHVYFAAYKRMKIAVAAGDWPAAAAKLGQIRTLIGINMMLGILTIILRYVL